MPRVGFEHTTLVLVREKGIRALKCTAIVIDGNRLKAYIYSHASCVCLSAKLVPTLAERGVSRSQSGGSPTVLIWVF
jgi:hypothetical protein